MSAPSSSPESRLDALEQRLATGCGPVKRPLWGTALPAIGRIASIFLSLARRFWFWHHQQGCTDRIVEHTLDLAIVGISTFTQVRSKETFDASRHCRRHDLRTLRRHGREGRQSRRPAGQGGRQSRGENRLDRIRDRIRCIHRCD